MFLRNLIIEAILDFRLRCKDVGMIRLNERDLSDWEDPYIKMCLLSKLIAAFCLDLDESEDLFSELYNEAMDQGNIEAMDVLRLIDAILASDTESLESYLSMKKTMVETAKRGIGHD